MKNLAPSFIALLLIAPLAYAQPVDSEGSDLVFGHLHLYVTDVELHADLWSELFSGEVVEKEGYTAVRIPGTHVFLTATDSVAPSHGTGVSFVGLEVADLDGVLEAWAARGFEPGWMVEKARYPEGANLAFLTFPDGLLVMVRENEDLATTARMHGVHYVTPEPSDLQAWYGEMLGATPAAGHRDLEISNVPGAGLVFGPTESAPRPTEGSVIDHVGFEIDDMQDFADRLAAAGVEFVFGPRHIESLDIWVVFFVDPNGVTVELTEGLRSF